MSADAIDDMWRRAEFEAKSEEDAARNALARTIADYANSPSETDLVIHVGSVHEESTLVDSRFWLDQRDEDSEPVADVVAGGRGSRIVMFFTWDAEAQKPVRRSVVLTSLALLLPASERGDWLEENLAYLTDTQGWLRRIVWVASQLLAMPRYAYVVRTDSEKESA